MLSFKLSKYPNTYLNSRHPFCIHIQDRIHIRVKMWYKMLSEFDSISASIHKKWTCVCTFPNVSSQVLQSAGESQRLQLYDHKSRTEWNPGALRLSPVTSTDKIIIYTALHIHSKMFSSLLIFLKKILHIWSTNENYLQNLFPDESNNHN
jgi:hypothetical protein